MARIGSPLDRLVRHYDKIIAIAVLIGLLISLVYLSVAGGLRRHIENQYIEETQRLVPRHPKAEVMDSTPYEIALREVREPYQIPLWSNQVAGILIPQLRVWCVDCRRPVAFDAPTCPYCRAQQPRPPGPDELREFSTAGDGIPDWWKRQYGLDIFSRTLAHTDIDGDGFTVLQEFRAGTDPTDADSHPPVDVLLRVRSLDGTRLPIRFMGRIDLGQGRVKCQFNVPGMRTPMAEPGETITAGAYSFVFERYEVRREVRPRPGLPPGEIDVHVATLRFGRQSIEIELGKDRVITDYLATLVLPLDGTEFRLRIDETFELRGNKYRMLSVDSSAGSVVIRNESTRQEITVPRL